MKTVTIARSSGFCPGVQNAFDIALRQPPGTYVLGDIIHNADVIKSIERNGIISVDSLGEIPDGATVVFRSHGVSREYYDECARRGIKIVNCTCPYVERTQKIVKRLHDEGKVIVIVGDREHPEVQGLLGWCEGDAYVVNDPDDDMSALVDTDVSVVCQTTFSEAKFDAIVQNIEKQCKKIVEVYKTICYTTIGRQKEAEELSLKCDAMIVIGGLNSSNTNKLYEICKSHCTHVIRLASSSDFDPALTEGFDSVGIVSGASTPKAQTWEVLLEMEENDKEIAAADSMEDVLQRIDNESKFKRGQIVTAAISQATEDGLLILLPFSKKEVALSKDDLDCEEYNQADYEQRVGEQIDLLVVDLKPSLKLSEKMIRLQKEDAARIAEIEDGREFSIECTGYNKGGLTGSLGSYTVFVPAKEIRPGFVRDLASYVGKKLRLRVIEIKKGSRVNEIIASQRVILQEEKDARDAQAAAREEEFFSSINVDDIVEGKVERTTTFGAFVSVKGFDCLAHISDLSWTPIKKPEDVLKIGETYQFKVLSIDRDKKKVSIGYKQLAEQPWDTINERYAVGDVVHGKVVRLASFGAFVRVEHGIDGLVHISQISHDRIDRVDDVLKVGEEVDVKIIGLDSANRRMNLSIKELEPIDENEEIEKKAAKPKKTRSEGGAKPRGSRSGKTNPADDGAMTSWYEGESVSATGTSIADLIAASEDKRKKE